MNNFRKLLSMVAILAMGFAIMQCKDDDGDDAVTPSKPQVQSDLTTLALKTGEAKTAVLTISAAGKIKDVTATADKGTVDVSDKTGVGEATGTAKVNYTAAAEAGAAKITVTVTDEASQSVTLDITVDVSEQPPIEIEAGDVEGTWGPDRVILVHGDVTVPKGKTLTVAEGTTVIIDGDGTGFIVEGNFYSMGTAEKPNLFTVPDSQKKKENIFAGLWGGILGTENSTEMVVLYSRFEYAGAPAKASTPIVTSGELEEGDPRFTLYFNNPDGKFIMQNSIVAYTKDDGMRINQGELLITNNTYMLTGESGGEGLNVKSGAVGDVAYNVFISTATNAIKWSNSDDRSPQNDVNVYNNTAINCGWRQTKAGRGGSFNLEKGGRGQSYNNMAVNCKYGTRFPKAPDNPDPLNSITGNNLYYGNNDESVEGFYPETGSIAKGDPMTEDDVAGDKGENDPKFANWDVTEFDVDAAKNSANADFLPDFDVTVGAGSPALSKGKTDFDTNFEKHTVAGVDYTVPAPSNFIGAKSN